MGPGVPAEIAKNQTQESPATLKTNLSKTRNHIQPSSNKLRHGESVKATNHKHTLSPVPENIPKKLLPGFFEDEDVLAVIEHANTKPEKLSNDPAEKQKKSKEGSLKSILIRKGQQITPAISENDLATNQSKGSSLAKSKPLPIDMPNIANFSTSLKHHQSHCHNFKETEVFRKWRDLKDQFLEAYEKKGGRKLHQGRHRK